MQKIITAVCLLVFMNQAGTALAQKDKKPPVRTVSAVFAMKGRTSMTVVVEKIPGLETQITPSVIKTNTELRLREIGIDVKQFDESDNLTPYLPSLYVNVNALRLESRPSVVYNISVEYKQFVDVFGVDDSYVAVTRATIWSKETVGITPLHESGKAIKETVDELLSAFLNDYLTANPKK